MDGSLGTLVTLPPEVRIMIWHQLFRTAAVEGRLRQSAPWQNVEPCRTRTAFLRASKDLNAESIEAFHAAFYEGMGLVLTSRRVIIGAPTMSDNIIEHHEATDVVSSRTVPDATGEYYHVTFSANGMRPLSRPPSRHEMRHVRHLRVLYSNPTSTNATGTREWDPDRLYVLQGTPEDPTPSWYEYAQRFTRIERLQLIVLCSRNIGLGEDRSIQLLSDTTSKIARPLLIQKNLRTVVANGNRCSNSKCIAAVRQALSKVANTHGPSGCRYYQIVDDCPELAPSYVEITPRKLGEAPASEYSEKRDEKCLRAPSGHLYVKWEQVVLPRHHRPNPIWVRPRSP